MALFCEELADIGKDLEFEGITGWIEEKHGDRRRDCAGACRRSRMVEVGYDLVAREAGVNPRRGTAAFVAAESGSVKSVGGVEVVAVEGNVETGNAHGGLLATIIR